MAMAEVTQTGDRWYLIFDTTAQLCFALSFFQIYVRKQELLTFLTALMTIKATSKAYL
jgi:hypothetical protein